MYKKIFILFIFLTLFFTLFSPTTLSTENNVSNDLIKPTFAAIPIIEIVYEPLNESVIPNSGVYEIPLKVYYHVVGLYANLQLMLIGNKRVKIQLSITEKPQWCTASIENANISISPKSSEPAISTLKISVTESAPAFTQGTVRIKATSSEIRGLIFKRVTAGEQEFDVAFVIGYIPVINYELEKNYYEIPSNSISSVPIKLTNLGNGPTVVNIKVKEIPANWNINYPSTVLLGSSFEGGDYETEFNIFVDPPPYFETENVVMEFTPNYKGRPDQKGQPYYVTLIFKNDGSSLENQGNIFSFTSPVLLSLTGLAIVLFLIYKKRYKK